MIKTITQHDVIRHTYHETTPDENKLISDALHCDQNLAEFRNELDEVKEMLDNTEYQPSDKTISTILQHAKLYNWQSV